MGKRANFEITNEVSDFKGPECPFWDSRVPIWDSRVNLFEIFERQEEIWALNKGKKQTYILLFSIYGFFLCNLKKITKMKKNFIHSENFFSSFWKSFSSFCSAKSVLASWIFLHFSVFFSSFCKFFSSFCKKVNKNAF